VTVLIENDLELLKEKTGIQEETCQRATFYGSNREINEPKSPR
jgi:hypothetical protein